MENSPVNISITEKGKQIVTRVGQWARGDKPKPKTLLEFRDEVSINSLQGFTVATNKINNTQQEELMAGRDDSLMVAPVETIKDDHPNIPVFSDEILLPEEKQRTKNIAEVLAQELGKIKQPPEMKRTAGQAAILGTNETASTEFFESVRLKDPDGYIIGVGVGNALSLLQSFPEGVVPRGMVLVDIDPKVVAVGKAL
ncbi:MAG: hypothetical protein AAB907_02885, partial [Patescibacteria group bacterium]